MSYRKTFCGKGTKRSGCGADMFVPQGSRIKLCNDCVRMGIYSRCHDGIGYQGITEDSFPKLFEKLNKPYLPRVKSYSQRLLEKEKKELMNQPGG